jgi:hypothetical protein
MNKLLATNKIQKRTLPKRMPNMTTTARTRLRMARVPLMTLATTTDLAAITEVVVTAVEVAASAAVEDSSPTV